MTPEEKSKIEELKKSLYSRSAPDIRTKRRLRFSRPDVSDIKTDWEHKEEGEDEVLLNKLYEDHSMSFFTKLLIGSIIFFLVAVGIGTLLVLKGSNIVSTNNIDITVNGPISVAGGTPVSFDVQVTNKNNIKLQTVDFTADFPDGTVDPDDTTKSLKQFRELMDDIEPGGVGQKTIRAVLYGQENTKKTITITVAYRVTGSNATFEKQKTFDVLISSSPLSVSVDSFKEVTSGQKFDMTVTLTSNSSDVLKNLILKTSYPFGYTFISSNVKPSADKATWNIGDLPPQGKKTITITGKLEGQDGEDKVFKFYTGAQSSTNPTQIGTQFVAAQQEIAIQKPFITVGISLDGIDGNTPHVASFNNPVRAQVSWFNNLPTAVIDGEIHLKLSGNAYDKLSVTPDNNGYYNSANNEIVWSKITTPELANIAAGGSGVVSFSIVPRDLSSSYKSIINPSITMDASVLGNRISESDVPESITSTANRTIQVSSSIALSAQVVRSGGPFTNTGPIPPRAEQATTYTVIMSLDNTANTLSGAQVQASLPAYVKWLGKVSPSSEDVTYNNNNGQVTWNIGNVDTYTQKGTHRRQVAFQISLSPSASQIGQPADLVTGITASAQDDFTGEALSDSQDPLTTRFSTDPSFNDGDELITK